MPHRIVSSGEMAELTRRFPWETTPLGPIACWPDELITTVNLLLASRYPMLLWWGPERIQFYNDAYRPSLREDKHPRALGQRGADCWQEIWSTIGPEIDEVIESGKATWNLNRLVPIFRNGSMEEVFWTYSYGAVRDRIGRPAGVLVVCNETTEQILSERRLRTLLAIEKKKTRSGSLDELAGRLVQMLASNRADIPFAVILRVQGDRVQVLGQTGLLEGSEVIDSIAERLPIREVAASQEAVQVDDFQQRVGDVICEPWPEPIRASYIHPAGVAIGTQYVLALGVSPRLSFDVNYASFLQLASNRICQLLENEAGQQERKVVEEQRAGFFERMNEQRDLLASIVESAPAGIAVLDGELRVKWCNPFFTTFFDIPWSAEQLLGRKLQEAVPHSEKVVRILEQVRDTNEPYTNPEYEHVGFARGITYWNWSALRLKAGDLLIVASEVTEQVAARRNLEAFSERLYLAQKAARLGTYDWHLLTSRVEWSMEFYEATGLELAIVPSWELYLSHVVEEDRELVRGELASVGEQGETLHIMDHCLIDKNGRERWIALTGHIHRNEDGVVERIIGTVSDITDRKRTEKDLEESQNDLQQQWAELEAIYRTAPIGLALFDPVEFRYLRLNSRQAESVGLPEEEILGKTLTEIAPIEGLREMFEEVARGKPIINALLEGELPMSPGEHRYWTVNYYPVYDSDGSIQAISAASLEITAQKRAELALIESEKIAAVGRLASSISHEINNPLEAVTNLLFLLRSEALSLGGRQYLAAAERELARVSQIATHTLRFHRQSTKPTEVVASEMIEPILALYLGRLNGSGITTIKQYRSEEKVLCFEGEIRQVLNNLIGNAIDAMWQGGLLILRTQVATDWTSGRKGVRITVADTGLGMTETTKRRLFEAFFTTKGINGTGLGLWISAEIVRKHGGKLRFRSRRQPDEKSGTVFQLFLPQEPVFLEDKETVRTQPR